MKKNHWLAILLATTVVFSPIAEAKRAGGGKSQGMTRNVQQTRPATPAVPAAPAQKKSNVGGMVAAGVVGAAAGALAANALADDDSTQQQENSSWGWLFWVALAALAFFLFRRFSAKKKLATANNANPYAPNYAGQSQSSPAPQTLNRQSTGDNSNIFGQPVGGVGSAATTGAVYTNSGHALPDGTEPAAFLRVARQRFNHIQAMNSASNIDEIRRYLTPDLYQAMYNDIMANQDHNVAEFSNLNAMVADSTTENGQYIVSVRFTGTVSEDLNSLPQPFTEIWHFVKPVGSHEDWLVAGIQQN